MKNKHTEYPPREASNKSIRPRKLATKLTLTILCGLIIIFSCLVISQMIFTQQDLLERELDKLILLAEENASVAKSSVETMVHKQDAIVPAILKTTYMTKSQQLLYIKSLLDEVKKQEPNILSLFLVVEPNTLFKNTPDGLCVYSTSSDTIIEYTRFNNINQTIYEASLKTSSITISDPIIKKIDGKEYKTISILNPIADSSGQIIGLVGSNIDTNFLNNVAYNTGGYQTFSNQIVCGHQTFIVNTSNPDSIGKSFKEATVSTNADLILESTNNTQPLTFLDTEKSGLEIYRAFVPFHVGTSKIGWLSGTCISKDEFNKTIIDQLTSLLIIVALSMLVAVAFCFILIKRALRPIPKLAAAAQEMAKGNLHISLDHQSNDEFGRLADSFRMSSNTIYTYVHAIGTLMQMMASGNFIINFDKSFIGDFQSIQVSISKFVTDIANIIKQIDSASMTVSTGSQSLSTSSVQISQGVSEQASTMQTLSSSLSIILEQVKRNAINATHADKKSAEVGIEIEESNSQMKNLTVAIKEINTASEQISKIIKVIEDIAFQTNILALNATVEAARAGEAGKGFAVVADEVRTLAAKSSEAAKDTTALIQNSISAVQNGVVTLELTAQALDRVNTSSAEIIALIKEISDASHSQESSISQVSEGMEQIARVIQINSTASQESASTSEELYAQACILKSLISNFKV